MKYPCDQTYALRLEGGPGGELAGELEHVLSGDRLRFASGAELQSALRCLQDAHAAAATAGAPDPKTG